MIGSLDLQKVLRDGEHAFSPGLLARAHGGVLYVDEVNLLHDHLVDVLLDAAAMGRVHVERDGVSHSHEARFVLIGTMNPEEGELRPQLLDRFGLTVDVRASRDVDVRTEVIRQRMAYEADPVGFAAPLRRGRRRRWPGGSPPRAHGSPMWCCRDDELRRIAALCAAFDVDGMRADLVVARTAVAHAAWRGADAVDERGHPGGRRTGAAAPAPPRPVRRPRPGSGSAGRGAGAAPATIPNPSPSPTRRVAAVRRPAGIGNTERRKVIRRPVAAPPPPRPSAAPAPVFRTRALRVPGVGEGAPGRRSRARNRSGAVVGVSPDDAAVHGLHLFAHDAGRGRPADAPAARCGRRPTTSAARSARAARATW